jgi:hypothetical protein
MSTYRLTYCDDTLIVELGQPDADIRVNGESIGRQVADGSCDVEACLRIAARHCLGPLYETREEAEAAGRKIWRDDICIWEDICYERFEMAE